MKKHDLKRTIEPQHGGTQTLDKAGRVITPKGADKPAADTTKPQEVAKHAN